MQEDYKKYQEKHPNAWTSYCKGAGKDPYDVALALEKSQRDFAEYEESGVADTLADLILDVKDRRIRELDEELDAKLAAAAAAADDDDTEGTSQGPKEAASPPLDPREQNEAEKSLPPVLDAANPAPGNASGAAASTSSALPAVSAAESVAAAAAAAVTAGGGGSADVPIEENQNESLFSSLARLNPEKHEIDEVPKGDASRVPDSKHYDEVTFNSSRSTHIVKTGTKSGNNIVLFVAVTTTALDNNTKPKKKKKTKRKRKGAAAATEEGVVAKIVSVSALKVHMMDWSTFNKIKDTLFANGDELVRMWNGTTDKMKAIATISGK